MVIKNADIAAVDLGKGISRKVLSSGGKMMTAQFSFVKGAVGTLHTHPHEQVGYVVHGSFELTLAGDKITIEQGDTYYVPPGEVHGVIALEDGVLLDVFTPQREDFLTPVDCK